MSLEAPELAETTVAPDARTAPRQPYPGLRPFDENEQRLFFGREYQIKEILRRLQQTYFAVVIGGSGSGKSSIVNAGVIPALRKKQLGASGDFWLAASFSPKDRPLWHLATVLADFIEPKSGQSAEETVEDVVQTLLETNSLAGFFQRYRSRLKLEEGQAPESREHANLLIFCDQFEEIFREQNRDNPETRQLVDLIVEAHRNRNDYPQLYVIIGMRSEDLHRCAAYIDLPNVINDASFLTRRLDETEIASAIVEPSRLVLRLRGIRPKRFEPIEVDPWPFEVDLLRRLNLAVASLAHNPDHLPLLQHLLSVLWRHVEGKPALRDDATRDPAAAAAFRITADDLAAALGFTNVKEADEFARRKKLPSSWILERALDQAAEGVMPTEDRLKRIAEMMFRLLALVDDRGIYIRRWTSRAEIADVARDLSACKRSGLADLARKLGWRLHGKRAEGEYKPASDDEIEAVIKAFTSVYPFLYVREGREGKIDVSHEAFIRNWTTFRDWLKDERTLALAFEALRTAYAKWREKLLDPHRRWLGRLSAICGDRLSGEKLHQMRDWWDRRSYNTAWAARYAGGMETQGAESEERQPGQISDTMLRLLRRYYRQSRGIRFFILAWPWLLSALLLVAGGYAFEIRQRAVTSDLQVAAFGPYRVAEAVETAISTFDWSRERIEEAAKARVFESVAALEILDRLKKPKSGVVEKYRRLRQGEADLGLIHSVASARADKAARLAMASVIWPVPNSPPTGNIPAVPTDSGLEMENLRHACQDKAKEHLRQYQRGDDPVEVSYARHTLATSEPHDGRRLLITQFPDTNLNFLLLSPEPDCPVKEIFTLTIPPNSKVDTDSDLRLIAVNTKDGDQDSTTTRLYRLYWTRQCKSEAKAETCSVEFSPGGVEESIHKDGPYQVVDSSHVKARGRQYQLDREHKPTLLSPQDAESALTAFGPRLAGRENKAVCDKRGPYVALLTAEKGGGQFDTLRVTYASGERSCEDYANERQVIMSFDLGYYSIRNLAFARKTSSTDTADDAPDSIYLQSEEPNVVYSLVWKSAKIRSILCEILRKQTDNKIPPMDPSANKLPISKAMWEALTKKDDYTPPDICKD